MMKKIHPHYDLLMKRDPFYAAVLDQVHENHNNYKEKDPEGAMKSTEEYIESVSPPNAPSLRHHEVMTLLMYRLWQQQIFSLGPRMFESFALTDLKDLRCSQVKLPYDVFYIHFEDSNIRLKKDHNLIGVYVSYLGRLFQWDGWEDTIFLNFVVDPKKPAQLGQSWSSMFGQVCVVNDPTRTIVEQTTKGVEDSDIAVLQSFSELQSIVRVVFNLLIYLNCVNRELETKEDPSNQRKKLERIIKKKPPHSPKRKEAERDLANLPSRIITWIAPSIEAEKLEESDIQWDRRGPRPHPVRGFWRDINKRFGPGFEDLRWVKPQFLRAKGNSNKPPLVRDSYRFTEEAE